MMPQTVTVRDVAQTVADPAEYVRRVFDNMRGYHRDCQVRLAVDRQVKQPDYLVELLIYDEEDGIEVAVPQAMAVFSGRTHTGEDAWGQNKVRTWSTEAMNWSEVQVLLGELRGI